MHAIWVEVLHLEKETLRGPSKRTAAKPSDNLNSSVVSLNTPKFFLTPAVSVMVKDLLKDPRLVPAFGPACFGLFV